MIGDIFFWIIFGAIVGWIASILTGRRSQMGCLTNIVVGVIGAFLGGWIWRFFGEASVTGFNFSSFLVAIIGAVVLLIILGFFQGRRR